MEDNAKFGIAYRQDTIHVFQRDEGGSLCKLVII